MCLFVFALPLFAQNQSPNKSINSDQLIINGIGLGASESELLQKLGDPLSSKESYDYCARGDSKTLFYSIGEVTLLDGGLVRFQCSNKSCKTADGIYPGMPKESVLNTYGKGSQSQHKDWIYYKAKDKEYCFLTIGFESNLVKSISIWCAVC